MNNKQTQCPECTTIYKVSVEQLTIAQGMVCCPKCFHSFNALLYLVQVNPSATAASMACATLHDDYAHETNDQILKTIYTQQHLLDIFERKIEHSNIDLRTYLNNLNYFSHEPIHPFPSLKLSEKEIIVKEKPSLSYYMIWTLINLCLVLFLVIQVLWFNPKLVADYPSVSRGFNAVCNYFNCQTPMQRYQKVTIEKVKLRAKNQYLTQISGLMINSHTKSIPLPLIVLSTQTSLGPIEYRFKPEEYLEEKYQGITRLPTQTPFKFSLQVPLAKNQIQSPTFEIIEP